MLARVQNPQARAFYEAEGGNARWSTREWKSQISMLLWETLFMVTLLMTLRRFAYRNVLPTALLLTFLFASCLPCIPCSAQQSGQKPPVKQTPQERELKQLDARGMDAMHKGDLDTAETIFLQALAKVRKLGKPTLIIHFLFRMGVVKDDKAEYNQALEYLKQALATSEKISDSDLIATSLEELGIVYSDLGLYDKALDHHSRALDIFGKLNMPGAIADTQNELGLVYQQLGQYDKALEYYKRALAYNEQHHEQMVMAFILNNMGTAYHDLGELDKALDYYTRSLAITEQLKNPAEIANKLNNIGNVYSALGQLNKAQESYTRATNILLEIGSPLEIAECYNNVGHMAARLGKYDDALNFFHEELTLREQLGSPDRIAHCLTSIGRIYMHQGKLSEAERFYARALNNFEVISRFVGDPGEIGSYQTTFQYFYQDYAQLLLRRNQPEQAFEMLERGHAQGLGQQSAQNRANLANLFSPDDFARFEKVATELTQSSRVAHSMESEPDDAARKAIWKQKRAEAVKRLDAAERAFSVLQASLFQKYPLYARIVAAVPLKFQAFHNLALQSPDTLYLQWGVDDNATMLFALSKQDGLKSFTIEVEEETLIKQVQDWREAALGPGIRGVKAANSSQPKAEQKERELAHRLYSELMEPLEKAGLLTEGRYKHLVLVGDGPLLELPFAVLMDKNGKRLLERFPISTAVSFTTLTWPQNDRKPKKGLLCIADPIGKQGEKQVTAIRGEFVPLQFAREEGKAVFHMFQQTDSQLLTGSKADEATVRKEMEAYALLHFATHGMINRKVGLLSALILAATPDGEGKYGVLLARDIVSMKLTARMAVLSACQTGQGQPNGNDGVLGLAWAFEAAGCPSVLASLWSVDDKATGDLMTAFYQQLLGDTAKGIAGKPKDEALRAAMLGVMHDGNPKHIAPYYWAAFQVIGDTSPLSPDNLSRK